jgi:AAA15 family ATPase/GTPase
MLIRFVVENLFSFGEKREFNLLPSPRYARLSHHKYLYGTDSFLKLSVLYGANGSGKSNLIKSISHLIDLVLNEEIPPRLQRQKFKFHKNQEQVEVLLGVEFISDEMPFTYALKFNEGIILNEELYISGMGKKEDLLIFERSTDENGKVNTRFCTKFEEDAEGKILKRVIENNLSKPERPLLKLLSSLNHPYLINLEKAYKWFANTIQVIGPSAKPAALAHRIDVNKRFHEYANEIMCAFHTGIKNINTEVKTLRSFFGEDNLSDLDELISKIDEAPQKMLGFRSRVGEEILIIKEKGEIFVKRLVLEHQGLNNQTANFYLNEESDGTIRLLDYIPVFQDVISRKKVYIIDEIERSIHPLLIKELINKFSTDENTQGQLIFSTHESNLLDQELFRQDEIWFAEKDKNACTDIYPLSEFKEHHTKNIRKGYLNGRYGGIPFLGNLQDLNWNKYATIK